MSHSYSSYSYSNSSTFNNNNFYYRGRRTAQPSASKSRNTHASDNVTNSANKHSNNGFSNGLDNTFNSGDSDPNSLHHQALLSPSTNQSDVSREVHSGRHSSYDYHTKSNSNNGDVSLRRRVSNMGSHGSSGNHMNSNSNFQTNIMINDNSSSASSTTNNNSQRTSSLKITIVVILWYVLGVVSISTTKIILRDYGTKSDNSDNIQISPLGITLQQLLIGSIFLKLWTIAETKKNRTKNHSTKSPLSTRAYILSSIRSPSTYYLTLTSAFFTLGFLFTNYSFSDADPTFVETIKASEPMTSAALAYLYKIESLSPKEIITLVSICVGVLISIFGNAHQDNNSYGSGGENSSIATLRFTMEGEDLMASLTSSGIVMCSNLCFSFRGLYQKLYRNSVLQGDVDEINNSSSKIHSIPLTDNQLQLRVHQIGVVIVCIPFFILEDLLTIVSRFMIDTGDDEGGIVGRINTVRGEFGTYILLALVNAFAFTHYNLASSYILTRISVVHHAALNCIRRLFAIVMTSIIFGVPITFIAGIGILVSIGGFIGFTYYKIQRKKRWPMNEIGSMNGSKSILPR